MIELKFEETSSACPEQYDVFKGGKQVGYIRLRHGVLSCRYPKSVLSLLHSILEAPQKSYQFYSIPHIL